MPRAFLLSMDSHDKMLKEGATVLEVAGLAYVADTNPLKLPVNKYWRYLLSGVVCLGRLRALFSGYRGES